jgi:hypothetical protein
LAGEKDLMDSELKLIRGQLDEKINLSNNLERDYINERKMREEEQKINRHYRQIETELNNKVNTLTVDKDNIEISYKDVVKINTQMIDELANAKNQFNAVKSENDKLKYQLMLTNDEISNLNHLLNEKNELHDKNIANKNSEIDALNAKINETIIDLECKLADQHNMHEHCITNLESNKAEMQEKHDLIKNDMDAKIQDFQEKLTQFRKSYEVVEVKLISEKNQIQEELNKKNGE